MIAALLLGLAAVGPPAPAEQRRQTVFVDWDATAKACVPQVNGVDTGDVGTDAGRAALVAALSDKGAALHLVAKAGHDIPYDCMADIVTTLKHAGFYGPLAMVSGPGADP